MTSINLNKNLVDYLKEIPDERQDVVTQEDNSPRLLGKASTNISLIKSWVLNLLRVHGYDSMTEALSYLSHNLPLLLSLCR